MSSAHSPTFTVNSPTSQFILQAFFRFSYVTSSSLISPGEPPMVQNCLVKCGINGLTCRNEFLMDDAFVVEEGDQQSFDLGFLQTTFLVAGKSVNTTPSIAVFIPDRTGSTSSHLL